MRRTISVLLSLLMTFAAQSANAGRILAVEASGNYNNTVLGVWNPIPNPSMPGYADGEFSTTIMFDVDECSNVFGPCTAKMIFNGPYPNFTTPWIGYGIADFSVTNSGIAFNYHLVYDFNSPKVDPTDSKEFVFITGEVRGNWDLQFNNLSQLINKKIPISHSDGMSGNASFNTGSVGDSGFPYFTMETGLEFVKFYYVPEPSSIALIGLALAGLAFNRRRKS